jgi:hypothetical protein
MTPLPQVKLVTQHDLDVAGEAVERAHMKRGKAQRRATASTAQASEDAQDLQACIDRVSATETELARLTDLFHEQRKGRIEPEAPAEVFAGAAAAAGLDQALFDEFRTEPAAAAEARQ